MSFLENPFADEEDEAVPDTSFGNYDALQRENKYNALILAEATLGNRRREVEKEHLAQFHTLAGRNTNLRKQLSDLSEMQTLFDKTPCSSVSSGLHNLASDALQPLFAALQQSTQDGEVAVARALDLTAFVATPPSDSHPRSPYGEEVGLRPVIDEGISECSTQNNDETEALLFDVTRLQHWVKVLIEDSDQTREAGEKNAEDDLICNFIEYIRSELRQYMELCLSVHTRRAFIQQKMSALERLKREGAVRLAQVVTETTACSPLFSSENVSVLLANKDLMEKTKRLEIAVALLLKNDSIKQKALGYVEIARRCRAEQRQIELRQENDEIGREVLFLRQLLSSSDITEKSGPSSEEQITDCQPSELTATDRMHKFNASIVSRIRQVEELLSQVFTELPDSAESGLEDVHRPPSETLTDVHVKVLEVLVYFQNSCLRVLTALNADLEVRAARASLLMQLVLHNGSFENRMVEAVLDLPSLNLSAFPREVSDYFADKDDVLFSQLQTDLGVIVSAAKRQLDSQIALANKARHLVLQNLSQGITEGALHEDLGVPVKKSPDCASRIVLEENIQQFMDAELAAASDAEDRLAKDISDALEERRTDLSKKLNWVSQQSQTETLRQLYALEQQNDTLGERLREEQKLLQDEQVVKPDLASLESRLQNIQLEVRTLEAEEKNLMEQILALQGAHAS